MGKIGETILRGVLAVVAPAKSTVYETGRTLVTIHLDEKEKNKNKKQELEKWASDFAVTFTKEINPLVVDANLNNDELKPVISAAQEWFSYVFSNKDILLKSGLNEDNLPVAAIAKYKSLLQGFTEQQIKLFSRLKIESIRILRTEITKNPYLAGTAVVALLEALPEIDSKLNNLDERVTVLENNESNKTEEEYNKFERNYRQKLYNTVNQRTEIGLLGASVKNQTYNISTAYISLWVNYQGSLSDEEIRHIRDNEAWGHFDKRDELILKLREGSDRFHKVLPKLKNKRLLIRGEAGSGKTTMLNWLQLIWQKGHLAMNMPGYEMPTVNIYRF